MTPTPEERAREYAKQKWPIDSGGLFDSCAADWLAGYRAGQREPDEETRRKTLMEHGHKCGNCHGDLDADRNAALEEAEKRVAALPAFSKEEQVMQNAAIRAIREKMR